MEILNNTIMKKKSARPIKIVQFGEGNFLRAFVDWFLQELNDAGLYHGDVAVIQPQPTGRIKALKAQDGRYTLIQEGMKDGQFTSEIKVIDVLQQFIDPYTAYEAYLKLAEVDTLEFVISNTTEAGIVLDETDLMSNTPPTSFPGKLLAFLHHRYETFHGDMNKGLYVIPCELIDDNGDELHRCLKELAIINGLSTAFLTWLSEANTFTNTLVDRIVPGYPTEQAAELTKKLGYIDDNMVMGEIYHLWVIEDRGGISNRLNGAKLGLNMIFTSDIKPYKIQKVRILNGLHTLMVPVAYLLGLNTVGDVMKNESLLTFIKNTTNLEIIPATGQYLPTELLHTFAHDVYDRFSNPQIHHELMAIALNAIAKFKSRLLPTALDYVSIKGKFPPHIAFSLASLLLFYKGWRHDEQINLQDDPAVLAFFKTLWQPTGEEISEQFLVSKCLKNTALWGMDLNDIPGATEQVVEWMEKIIESGMAAALRQFLASIDEN